MSLALALVAAVALLARPAAATSPVSSPGTSYDAQWAASLAPNSEVALPAGTYRGPWTLAAGVRLTAAPGAVLRSGAGADATLTLVGDAHIEGLTIEVTPGGYGIRVGAGKAKLSSVHLTADRRSKAAVFVAHGEIVIRGGQIDGLSDYGVLAEKAGRVAISGTSIRSVRAGVATVFSPTDVEGCSLVGPFSEAAIALLQAPEARLARNTLSAVKTMGIKLTTSTATLSHNRVTGARADAQGLEGNSLYAYDSTVTLAGDELGDPVIGSQGPVLFLAHSAARLDGVRVRGAPQSLVYMASKSTLTASNSELQGAPVGLAVEEGSTASAAGFRFVNVTRQVMALPP